MSKKIKWVSLSLICVMIISLTFMVFAVEPQSEIPIPSFENISPFVDSNRYTHAKSLDIATNQQEVNVSYDTIETDLGTVYLDTRSLAFQFYNSNGYLWSSTIDYESEDFPLSVIYSLRSAINIASYNTNNVNFAILREHVFTLGSSVDVLTIDNGFKATIVFGTSRIKLNMYVTFTEQGVQVVIPYEEIEEPTAYKLQSIQVYRDFGSVKEDSVPGYVFIPDGIGALIDYKPSTMNIPDYKKYIYGNTIGYNKESNLNNRTIDGRRIYMPVFGFVHGINQQAVFAHIESGAVYGNINVSYPSRNRGYTSVYPEFIYRSTYAQPIDRLGNDIILLQDFINPVDIHISYTLLENEQANYVGMALTYKDQLINQGILNHQTVDRSDIPLHVSTIGLERKQGVLFTENIVMTTLKQFKTMIETLNHQGIDEIVATIDGFTQRGASWSSPSYTGISRRVGSSKDLEDINDLVRELYLITDFMMASSKSGGYNRYTDLAKKINNQLYRYENSTDIKYLLEHSKVSSLFKQSLSSMKNLSYSGFAVTSFGSILYDDFAHDKYLLDQIEMLHELLSSSLKKIALFDANAYMWGHMDTFFDLPMYSSQFLIFDDTVPFMSIALSQTMDLFGSFANFYPYARDELLRLIDFNVYPSFIVTYKSSKYLQKTGLESIYSSRFNDLDHVILTYYDFVNQALKHTLNAHIISRDILANGISLVGYSNGVEILINYTNQDYMYLDQLVPPKSYYVGGIS